MNNCDTSARLSRACRTNRRRRSPSIRPLIAAAGIVLLWFSLPAAAQPSTNSLVFDARLPKDASTFAPNQLTLSFAPEYYYWQENANGAKLLDESGIRYGLELAYKQRPEKGWLVAARVKGYYGAVDYNGQTQGGTPVKTTTDYYGGLGEFRGGYRWGLSQAQYLDLMGGFGLEYWERSLQGSGGYNEYWMPIYLKSGLEISPRETGWIGALDIKLPVYTTQTVDQSRLGGPVVVLHPAIRPGGYAEAGYQFTKNISVVAYFDSYWFAQSPTVASGGFLFYQPESFTYQAGVKLGWTF